MRRECSMVAGIISLSLLFGCAGGGPEGVSAECAAAFEEAAAVSDLQDTHADLFPAYSACTTLDEWKAADAAYPDAIDGADPVSYARNVCGGNSAQLSGTPICRAVSEE